MRTSRRELLAAGTAAALGAVPGVARAQAKHHFMGFHRPKRVLRFAHVTDIHVQPERQAALGFERCLEHCQDQKVEMIMTGGDMVMDCLTQDIDRVKSQWEIFDHVLRANTSVRVQHCIGNHDVWGWGNVAKYKDQPAFGKRYALERLEMERPYYSFNRAGWHFIVLDSTQRRRGNGYTAMLDEPQFEWLKADLDRTPDTTPIVVISHIPILSVCAYFDGDNERSGNWTVPGAWMHIDARRIKDLFHQHANIKACLSGHIHLVDRVKYLGIPYYCNGAVCGGWWTGPFQESRPGYAVVDLFDNGYVENRFIEYGWNAKPCA